ncbi:MULTISPECIES: MSMEG_0570 family nitrogen starvation response protein [unclassified Curtobacterium]|uniref:MSMEG_0570 family nitrogen starvation response protein n=1 Tax=unclassified Curtobacterium TaxID=257496 RepID=UPI00226B9391|nr:MULTISPECIES: MSMEG_0570 family nitrogen starvation response protein [unclassified Curtobacterium]
MPEMQFAVRWPDGTESSYYSPSLVMHDFLDAGSTYPVDEFVRRATEALDIASERVRAKYGFACTSAMHTQESIALAATRTPLGDVTVTALEPPVAGAPA